MRRPLFVVLAMALIAAILPLSAVGAITPPGLDCGPDDGRERLTAEGFDLDFQAPETTATGHDVADLAGAPYPQALMERATAHFRFRVFPAPATSADLRIAIDWAGQGDLDLDVYDEQGSELGASHTFNPLDGNGELILVEDVAHCTDIRVLVSNYLASPEEIVHLDMDVTPGETLFACEEEDPHPACAGKLAGESPDVAPDTRTRLYLDGDRPGQLAMQGHYVNKTAGSTVVDAESVLTPQRPVSGQANQFTHVGTGNPDQNQNPFMANFTVPFAGPTRIQGDVRATTWVSSQTLAGVGDNPASVLYMDLWADSFGSPLSGVRLARVEVPGSVIGAAPTPLTVTFDDLDATAEEELTLQLASPRANDTTNPSDVEWTVHYGSVQFPSHLTLDLPDGALAP